MPSRLRRTVGITLGLAIASAVASAPALAITDEEIFRQFKFNFINPGGRALAMGGASVASVNDATASVANPGAMVWMVKKEFFFEARGSELDDDAFAGRTLPDNVLRDPATSRQFGAQVEGKVTPTYFAFVQPFTVGEGRGRRRMAWGIGRQEILNTETTVSSASVRVGLPQFGPGEELGVTGNARLDMKIGQINGALAAQLTRNWALGVTGTRAKMTLESASRTVIDDPGGFFITNPPGSPSASATVDTVIPEEEDTDFSYSVGLQWRPESFYPGQAPPITLGLVYNRGPEFEVSEQILPSANAGGLVGTAGSTVPMVLKVPDRLGFGFMYQWFGTSAAANQFFWTVDVVGVRYEDLLEGYVTNLNPFTIISSTGGTPAKPIPDIDNGVEYRTGFEWRTNSRGGKWRHAFRLGYARLPPTQIFFRGFEGTPEINESALLQYFSEGASLNSYSGGFGVAFIGSTKLNAQLDVAYERNDEGWQSVVSSIWRF